MLRVLEPALRMKAQTDSNSRGRKDFICREFSWRKEKRKTAYWGMQGDPETGDPPGQVGEWGFIAYLHCLMPSDANRRFLGRKSVSLTTYRLLGPPKVRPSVLHLLRWVLLDLGIIFSIQNGLCEEFFDSSLTGLSK
jgi:hypothetical protein